MSRGISIAVLVTALIFSIACTNKKVSNPLANVGSKQPDKVLFDRAMDALKHNRFDVARLTLQTLINTYPDSEFVARAKLGVADSWYAEGGSTALAQAELEYTDFITFFPNMPEAAEAQLKIANIHYQQMEKPDRDYTHALRAEQEYRKMIQQFPDSKLVPTAKQRLREVQEVLAEREFEVGRFYYLRQSYAAATARLESLVEQYPLYSKADEALYLLGQIHEAEIQLARDRPNCTGVTNGVPTPQGCMGEAAKGRFIADNTKQAAETYSQILTRYPVMDRADDAKARLEALHQPVPRPTKAAVAQNKAEEDSRRESPMLTKVLRNFSKHPDVAEASRVGDPTMADPEPVSATQVMHDINSSMAGTAAGDKGSVSVETIGSGEAPPNGQVPTSENPAPAANADTGASTAAQSTDSAAQPATNELTPNVSADPNELKPNVGTGNGDQALPPPQQVNEIQNGAQGDATGDAAKADAASGDQPASDADISSSKHKKKKGFKKIIP